MTGQLDLFRDGLPARPYCTDSLANGLVIRDRMTAISKRYVQPNSPWYTRWLVYDVDRPTAAEDWQDVGVAAPNIVAMNPANGHAHLLYGLAFPVAKHPANYGRAYRYGAAVEGAYRKALEADQGYAGLVCKNPLHGRWTVATWQPHLYDLDWLADWPGIVLGKWEDKRRRLEPYGLGRNCTLFERLRLWSYRAIQLMGWPELADWRTAVLVRAWELNNFPVPLPASEIRATSKSVAVWTWKHITRKAYTDHQTFAARKLAIKRKAEAEDRAQGLLDFAATLPPGTSIRAIARMTGTPFETTRRLLQRPSF